MFFSLRQMSSLGLGDVERILCSHAKMQSKKCRRVRKDGRAENTKKSIVHYH